MQATGQRVVIFSAFLLNLAGFAVFSFLAVYLTFKIGLNGFETGIILSILTLSSRAFPFFTGLLGDRIGYKTMMTSGLLLRSAGFLGLALSGNFEFIALSSFLIGFGAACYEPSALAFFSAQQHAENKRRSFFYLNMGLNAGAAVGPLLGGMLFSISPTIPFVISSIIFLLLAFVQIKLVPPSKRTLYSGSIAINFKKILHNKPYLLFCFTMIFYWFLFVQLTVVFPVHMYNMTQSEQWVSYVITVNAITGISLMLFAKKAFEYLSPLILIRFGFLLTSLSFFLIMANGTPYWLLFCVIIFTIGETMILPSSDFVISLFSKGENEAAYYGFSDFSFAIGASLGSFIGTLLLQQHADSIIPWLLLMSIGLIGFVFSLKYTNESENLSESELRYD
ncbi:MFS transporter [Jeotgalibacillus sp. R-1-5s-1]|uniref:MDR family MFS transporter n=1 Tax=Jeotgalibacillus sp. R-1-5s-1 TaxID=2555897 RepID=UPI00106C68DF|nr:MFS transporter [Jeotgalibacillus sp. R-1-5s-1]TFD94425.1 MFS transporter [Jeotgalibacillus sp. R-1-5s-1]